MLEELKFITPAGQPLGKKKDKNQPEVGVPLNPNKDPYRHFAGLPLDPLLQAKLFQQHGEQRPSTLKGSSSPDRLTKIEETLQRYGFKPSFSAEYSKTFYQPDERQKRLCPPGWTTTNMQYGAGDLKKN